MKLWKFETYDEYLNAQIRGTVRRKRRNQRGGTSLEEAQLMRNWYTEASNIMCHGAGNGAELTLIAKAFPEAKVIGTDLVLWGKDVEQWDFNKQKPEWVGKFDIIYTNSMDHSPDPVATIQVWLEQLTPSGVIMLQWNSRHAAMEKIDTMFRGGDCFASTLEEFIQTFEQKSRVLDLIYCGRSKRRGSIKVLVVVGRAL